MKKKILIGTVFLSVFFLLSSMEYDDEQKAIEHYCKMVEEGYWGAFKNGVNCEFYGNIDDLVNDDGAFNLDWLQLSFVSRGRGCGDKCGNVDDLIKVDGSCDLDWFSLDLVSKGRGSDVFYGNIDDLIKEDGSCDFDGGKLLDISINRGKAKVKK